MARKTERRGVRPRKQGRPVRRERTQRRAGVRRGERTDRRTREARQTPPAAHRPNLELLEAMKSEALGFVLSDPRAQRDRDRLVGQLCAAGLTTDAATYRAKFQQASIGLGNLRRGEYAAFAPN